MAIVWTLRPAPVAGEYHALSAPAEAVATAVVRFRPDATEAQIRQGLKDSGARLVDGPTVSDAYVVRLPREHYAAALDKLRKAARRRAGRGAGERLAMTACTRCGAIALGLALAAWRARRRSPATRRIRPAPAVGASRPRRRARCW